MTPPAPITTSQLDQRLAQYAALIRRYGKRANLVGDTSAPFLEDNLIGGSLSLALALPDGVSLAGSLVDVGSGSGLPGIPLALAYPDLRVELCEVRRKRLAFLDRARHELGLRDLRLRECDAAELPRAHYDWAVSRAFEAPTKWMARAAALVRPGGHVGVFASGVEWEAAEVPETLVLRRAADDPSAPGRVVAVLQRPE